MWNELVKFLRSIEVEDIMSNAGQVGVLLKLLKDSWPMYVTRGVQARKVPYL